MREKAVWIPIVLFGALLFGGFLWGVFQKDRVYSDTENRYLAARPEFSWQAVADGSFMEDYEAYITDQFPERDRLVGLKTRMEAALGRKEIKSVWLAKEGYLIVNYPASDFESAQALKNLDALARAVEYYVEALGEDHVRVILAPEAGELLEDKLPRHSQPYDTQAYVGQAEESVQRVLVDVRKALSAHRKEYIYYRTDHHWTTLGAYYAYEAWAESLGLEPVEPALRVVSEDFVGTTWSKLHALGEPDEISVYDAEQTVTLTHNLSEVTEGFYDWQALGTRDQYGVFLGGNDGLLEIQGSGTKSDSDSVLLVVKDSFANCFIPFAACHYDRILVADLRYLNMSLQALAAEYGVTDVLVLYHVQGFATETTVFRIAR